MMTPIDWRTRTGCRTTSWPLITAVPVVGRTIVHNMLMVVVFPARFGPRKRKTSPRSAAKFNPLHGGHVAERTAESLCLNHDFLNA